MKREHSLPTRDQIKDQYKWRLEDLYEKDELWEKDYQKAKESIPYLASFQGKLGESAQSLLKGLQAFSDTFELVEKLFVYAHMRRDEDNTRTKYQAMSDRAMSLNVEVSSASSYITPEILKIPRDRIRDFLKQEKGLEIFSHYLDEIIRQKDHILSEREEMILAQAGDMANAPENIFTMLNNADLKFPVILDEEGREVEITHGRFITLMESKDRRVRKDAFEGLYHTYEKYKNTLASILNGSVKKDIFYSRMRKYSSALKASLDQDNVPVQVYDRLIDTVHQHLPALHRYLSLRKKALGLDEIHMYDLYVSMVKDYEMKVPYQEAKEMVKKGLEPLGEDYGRHLSEGLENGWVDVYENRGKTGGAYSWGAYGTHPYVLLNYQDNLDNVFTLAHEMGHALHSYYSNENQPYINAGYKILVAEVASTVNEALLMAYMLERSQDRQERLYLLNHFMEQFRTVIYRQVMFAEFEKLIHRKVEEGEALTPKLLCSMYRDLNVQYYGPDIVVDEEIAMEWARIPHFYSAFYVYKYATGFASAIALSQMILKEGQQAVDRYIRFLSSGGSDYPLELLKRAGVDLTTPKPVADALRVFEETLDQMEELL
ncbi:MAG: oligoendopeptidase F [Clostridia bacterium]